MWIKIENEIFYISDLISQYHVVDYTTSRCSIIIDIDIIKYPNYLPHFIKMYESKKSFVMSNNSFVANACLIKSLDIIFRERITLNIICNKIDSSIDDVRDGIIDDILNND